MEICGLISDPERPKGGRHRELCQSEMTRSEEAVKRVMDVICNFTNPWTVHDKSRLYSLASGAPMPIDVEIDVMRADQVGKKAKNEFIKDRLLSTATKEFFDRLHRQKLRTMELSAKKVNLKTSSGKVIFN